MPWRFLETAERRRRLDALRTSQFFAHCTDEELLPMVAAMQIENFKDGDVLIDEGKPVTKMYMIVSGRVERERTIDDQIHKVDLLTTKSQSTFGALHMLRRDPAYAKAICVSPTLTAYTLESSAVEKVISENPKIAMAIINCLAVQVRDRTLTLRTPLFEQTQKSFTWGAITVAASVESFYRSALNSWLNYRLTGTKGAVFPNMHIQLPTRVAYINGFKGLRYLLDKYIHPEHHASSPAIRFGAAFAPGVIMTPISSILEACNAGHMNPEPLWRRWTRGLMPRAVREVIFGIGLNQLSDYCEERVPYRFTKNETLRQMMGSMSAGVLAGYLSHVPHNLSTLKLMSPDKSYRQLYRGLAELSLPRVPAFVPESLRYPTAYVAATIFPRGVTIRTTQVIGSFIILNLTIEKLKGKSVTDFVQPPSFLRPMPLGVAV